METRGRVAPENQCPGKGSKMDRFEDAQLITQILTLVRTLSPAQKREIITGLHEMQSTPRKTSPPADVPGVVSAKDA